MTPQNGEYTVGRLKEALAGLPDELPVSAWCDDEDAFLPVLTVKKTMLSPDEEAPLREVPALIIDFH